MNVVLIVPTGIGAEIGGHAGDANPVAKLIGACCDILITHPNVVNASDINEMPPNALYVEGSVLDRFLGGEIRLEPSRRNKIILAVNSPVQATTINSVSAARNTIGADIEIVELKAPLIMRATTADNGVATGDVVGVGSLVNQLISYRYDALAIQTKIEVSEHAAREYVKTGGVNPWGGVEAMASRLIAAAIDKPVAHAPLDSGLLDGFNEVVDSRMAAEFVSVSYLHCVLKGLHTAPRIVKNKTGWPAGVGVGDIDALVSPFGCVGEPHFACFNRGIPVIAVRENQTCLKNKDDRIVVVENYWEAAGYLMAMSSGIVPEIVRRRTDITKPPCLECGAMTQKEAETKCKCAADKDDCHGCELWPD